MTTNVPASSAATAFSCAASSLTPSYPVKMFVKPSPPHRTTAGGSCASPLPTHAARLVCRCCAMRLSNAC